MNPPAKPAPKEPNSNIEENIESIDVELSSEILHEIQKIYMQIPDPAC